MISRFEENSKKFWGDNVQQEKIVVADNDDAFRKAVSDILTKKGYKVYQASDTAGTLRISRSIIPSLVIIDVNLRGMNAFDTARIVEEDNIATVIFITGNPDKSFFNRLEKMNIYAYLTKPINPSQLIQIVEFSIINSYKIKSLKDKVQKLENSIEARKKIEKAKGILIQKLNISEDEAYKRIRKKSMDDCVSMDIISDEIISKYS